MTTAGTGRRPLVSLHGIDGSRLQAAFAKTQVEEEPFQVLVVQLVPELDILG
jgi:hypothetical protein